MFSDFRPREKCSGRKQAPAIANANNGAFIVRPLNPIPRRTIPSQKRIASFIAKTAEFIHEKTIIQSLIT